MEATRSTAAVLRYGIIIALMILTACCFLLTAGAFGDGGAVEVSVRVAPTIQITRGGSVWSNAAVKSQVVDGVLTVMHL